ncbi:MAG: hypothetical protein Q9170_005461 [Blastenia crenularia]
MAASPRACKRLELSPKVERTIWGSIKHFVSSILSFNQGSGACAVESLWVHPIKSCRAVEVEEIEVQSAGLKFDRRYSFAFQKDSVEGSSQAGEWEFVTQRKYGRLANIQVEVWVPDPDSLDYAPGEPNVQSDGVLVVRYPALEQGTGEYEAQKSFELPYCPTEGQIRNQGYTIEKMNIWKDSPDSLLITSTDRTDSPPWIHDIQAYLKCSKPFALFRVANGHEREVFRDAPSKEVLGYQSVVGFADAYPLHILGLASVEDLDRRLTNIVPWFPTTSASRFRANIYFRGAPAYAEDSWKRITIGQQIFHVVCRTVRCALPNTDQLTGKKHGSEPSRTMKTYRNIDPGAGKKKACMGMQMVPAAEQGSIKVGDKIVILEEGEHHYTPE